MYREVIWDSPKKVLRLLGQKGHRLLSSSCVERAQTWCNRQTSKPTNHRHYMTKLQQMPEMVPIDTHFLHLHKLFTFMCWSPFSEIERIWFKLENLMPSFLCEVSVGFSRRMFDPSSDFNKCLFIEPSSYFWLGAGAQQRPCQFEFIYNWMNSFLFSEL
jgi:hypothetical protein